MLRLLLLIALLLPLPLYGQEGGGLPVAAETPAPAPLPAPAPAFPGVGDVVPRAAQVAEQGAQLEGKLAPYRELESSRLRLVEAGAQWKTFEKRAQELGPMPEWPLDRLLDIRRQLIDARSPLGKELDQLSQKLEGLEGLRRQWGEIHQFWEGWKRELESSGAEIPQDAFRQTSETIAAAEAAIASATTPLLDLQRDVTTHLGRSQELLANLDSGLAILRKQTFKKNAPSFGNPAFYTQFKNPELWLSVKNGISTVQGVNIGFFQRQGWVLLLQVVVAGLLIGAIRNYRRRVESTAEWQFMLRHAWATGLFVVLVGLSPLYSAPPPLWRLLLFVVATMSAVVLICGLVKNPRKRMTVVALAGFLVLSLALRAISLPQPFYRLYIAFICLAGIPLLLHQAQRNRQAHGGKVNGFTFSLYCGAVVLIVALTAQAAGYNVFAAQLVENAVKAVFIGLFAAMALRLGRGGIDFLLARPPWPGKGFFRRFGKALGERLKRGLRIVVAIYALLYLLETWSLFDSVAEAGGWILGLSFTVGESDVTVGMLAGGLLTLYLAVEFSWIVRALLETEFFPRQRIERGVRDSIKRLLHYFLIFLGFLLALSVAGIELRNFAILAGAFGIGIGFGLQNIVNNFVSGLILLFERPIKLGDMVVIGEDWGTVRKIGLRSTVVETLDSSEIIVPNSDLISEKVSNWTLSTSRARIVVPVGVAYGSNVPLVMKVLDEVARQHPEVLEEPPPSPIFTAFGDSSLDFQLRVWVADISHRLVVRSEILQAIDRRFRSEGIEIPFPQRDLHLRSSDVNLFPPATSPAGPGSADGAVRDENG